MQLSATLKASGLQPHGSYALSLDTQAADGHGVNVGMSDQLADADGHIVFGLIPTLLQAIANTGAPCDVRIWIRHGGTAQDAPPVAPKYQLTTTAG